MDSLCKPVWFHAVSCSRTFRYFLRGSQRSHSHGNQLDLPKVQIHDHVIKWKHFPRYWPFVRGIHRSTVNSPHKGQWRGALVFSLICAWINAWVNNREAGDLRRSLWRHCNDKTNVACINARVMTYSENVCVSKSIISTSIFVAVHRQVFFNRRVRSFQQQDLGHHSTPCYGSVDLIMRHMCSKSSV